MASSLRSLALCRHASRLTAVVSRSCVQKTQPNEFLFYNGRAGPVELRRQLHFSPLITSDADMKVKSNEELVPERLFSQVVIKVKGADVKVLESYCRFVVTAGKAMELDISGRVALPTRIQKFTVLKSIHIFKKHRVQYEVRTHMRLMKVSEITGTTADIFLEYIQRNLPEGVAMSVYQERLDTLPTLLMSPPEGEEAPSPPPTRPTNTKKQKK